MTDLRSIVARFDKLGSRGVFLLVVTPLFLVFFGTANRALPYHADALTNALTAWNIGERGTVFLEEGSRLAEPDYYGNVAWFVETESGHTVSHYPPGAALLAAPLYVFVDGAEPVDLIGTNDVTARPVSVQVPSLVPAAVVSAATAAGAAGFIALSLIGLVGNRMALAAGLVAGLGTGTWSVASNALWQHGPTMFWLSLGVYQASKERHFWAGSSFALAILTRPHVALVAAATGLWLSWSRRSLMPAAAIGAASSVGLAALVGYNWLIFETASISGGYGPAFTEQFARSKGTWFIGNVIGALFDPSHGLLIWAPFLLLLIPGLGLAWRLTPDWARGAAMGGILYLLVQLKANRFSGGDGHFAYRYPLETLVAVAPLLVLAYREWTARSPLRTRAFRGAALLAVVAQAIGAIID